VVSGPSQIQAHRTIPVAHSSRTPIVIEPIGARLFQKWWCGGHMFRNTIQ